MSVKAAPFSPGTQVIKALDAAAGKSLGNAKRTMDAVVAAEVPGGGVVERALKPKVSRTSTGQALSIGASRGARHPSGATVNQVIRWTNRGTGTLREGPGAKFPIHSPRWGIGATMTLPGGAKRISVKGQRPNPFMERIRRAGDLRVPQTIDAGAREAMDAIAKVLR